MKYESIKAVQIAEKTGRRTSAVGYLLLEEIRGQKCLRILSAAAALDLLSTVVLASVPSPRAYWYGLLLGSLETLTAALAVVGKVPESAIVLSLLALIHGCINLDLLLESSMLQMGLATQCQWVLAAIQEVVLLPAIIWFSMSWFFIKHKNQTLSNELVYPQEKRNYVGSKMEKKFLIQPRACYYEQQKMTSIDNSLAGNEQQEAAAMQAPSLRLYQPPTTIA